MHATVSPLLQTALLVVVLCQDAASVLASQFDVDRYDDSAAFSACTIEPLDCSLRGAIIQANAHAGADSIWFPAGTYVLTVTGQYEDAAATGDLDITDTMDKGGALTLMGDNRRTVIDANRLDRVFEVLAGVTVTMSGLVIQGGDTTSGPGGGIANHGTLTMTGCTLSGNSTASGPQGGGGISNFGTLTLTDCTLSNNVAWTNYAYGGGIYNEGTATLTNSTFDANSAHDYGGGIFNHYEGHLTMTNCTVSGNSAGSGGGISNAGIATLTNCTLRANSYSALHDEGNMTVINSVVANSLASNNCFPSGSVTSLGHNLSDDSSCGFAAAGDLENVPAGLVPPLSSNGGPTQTHALCVASDLPHLACTGRSAAIDAGDDTACPTTDQRHLARPQDGKPDPAAAAVCDIGAFEAPPLPCPDLNGDDKTDIVDAMFIAQSTVGLRTLSCQMLTTPSVMSEFGPLAPR